MTLYVQLVGKPGPPWMSRGRTARSRKGLAWRVSSTCNDEHLAIPLACEHNISCKRGNVFYSFQKQRASGRLFGCASSEVNDLGHRHT